MTPNPLTPDIERYRTIRDALAGSRLAVAIEQLKDWALAAQSPDQSRRIEDIESTYRYLLQYLVTGAEDPTRPRMLRTIAAGLATVADTLLRHTRATDTPTLYYNTLRYKQRNNATLAADIQRYRANPDAAALRNLFESAYVLHPWDKGDLQAMQELLEESPDDVYRPLVAAAGMGELEFHDPRRMELLATLYTGRRDNDSRLWPLIYLIMAMYRHRRRVTDPATADILDSVRDMPSWHSDMTAVYLELARARDTENVTRTMRDDIIPGMMDIKKDIDRKMRDGDLTQPASEADLTENPMWRELLENSAIQDKLREFTQMQEEGSDVLMASFAHLKSFPFFNDMMPWFVPYNPGQPLIQNLLDSDAMRTLARVIEEIPGVCDSDKYSMLLSVAIMPEAQRDTVMAQMDMYHSQLRGAMQQFDPSVLTATERARRAVNMAMRNIYRFNNLYRRKGEFYNIFAHGGNLVDVPLLNEDIAADAELVRLMGEFYLRKGYWDDAVKMYANISPDDPDYGDALQKTGYSHEKAGRRQTAYDLYRRALDHTPGDKWLLKRLAAVARQLGLNRDARTYLTTLLESRPEDRTLLTQLGYTLTTLGQHDKALAVLYKLDYLYPDTPATLRAIAWNLLMTGDTAKSLKYFDRVNDPGVDDLVNRSYAHMLDGRFGQALKTLAQAVGQAGGDRHRIMKIIDTDTPALQQAGLGATDLALVRDAMMLTTNR